MRCILLGATLSLVHPAFAAPPADADQKLAPWFNNLRAPWTNALCCTVADCRPVQSRTRDDHYEVFVGGAWQSVPDDKILQRSDNPTGHAVVCWTPTAGIMCFVRPPES